MNRFDKTPIIAPQPPANAPASFKTAAGLLVLKSPDPSVEGRFFALADRLCVGRVEDEDVTLAIDDGVLSRRHFAITPEGEGYRLDDLTSTNGTFVEGQRVSRKLIELGTIIRAGETLFELNELPVPLQIGSGSFVWRAPAMVEVVAAVKRVAPTPLAVLIEGATGSGKELIARDVHDRSGRSGAFVAVNCAAVPAELSEAYFFGHKKGSFTGASQDAPGVWVDANNGTLFLDEVGDLPLPLQGKLLRALEAGELTPVGGSAPVTTNARIVAATNVDLLANVERGTFRRDLYARLATYVLHAPTLRERRGDIPLLLESFFAAVAPGKALTMSTDFLQRLLLHRWPMNVRELRALALRLSVDHPGEPLEASMLPEAMQVLLPEAPDPSADELRRLLELKEGRVADIAAMLGKDRKQVYRWLKRFGLDADSFRRRPKT